MLSAVPPSPPPLAGAFPSGPVSPRVQQTGASAVNPEAPSADARATEASGKAESARDNPESKPSAEKQNGDAQKNPQGLSDGDLQQLTELKARDREVRAHEAAHQAVGGQYAGAVSYTYQRGPDGAQYAVGGEVSIDLSPVQGDPQATVDKMRIVRAAAMAPAEPSAQDRAVAAQAMQIMLQAQSELAVEPGSSRNATNAYREVSAMGDEKKTGVSAFEPVSA